MSSKKLISKYNRIISSFRKKITFYEGSIEHNEEAKRVQVVKEMKLIVDKLNMKIRVYQKVICDLKEL